MSEYNFNGNVKVGTIGNKPFNEWDQKCEEIKQLKSVHKDVLTYLNSIEDNAKHTGVRICAKKAIELIKSVNPKYQAINEVNPMAKTHLKDINTYRRMPTDVREEYSKQGYDGAACGFMRKNTTYDKAKVTCELCKRNMIG